MCGNNLRSGEKAIDPGQKGVDSISRASEDHGDAVYITEGQVVNEQCHRAFINWHITSHLKKNQDESVGNIIQTLLSVSERAL